MVAKPSNKEHLDSKLKGKLIVISQRYMATKISEAVK